MEGFGEQGSWFQMTILLLINASNAEWLMIMLL
jgi:hypothetical protein